MFNTNGLRLTEKTASDLLEAGLTRIMISLDAATEATYRLMRPGSDFALVQHNVLELLSLRKKKRRRLPLVRLSFCLTSLNEAELPAFIERWSGQADFLSVQSYGHFGAGPSRLFPGSPPLPAPSGRCAQPFKRLSVLHDGRVLPCCDLSGLELTMGRAGERSLADIWRGPEIAAIRAGLLSGGGDLPPECRRCQGKFAPAA
jgi:radical SAM protein with 4Fe4S-binding SPASM domain